MNKVLAAELYKLKHSMILWLIPIGALLSPVTHTVSALISGASPTWEEWASHLILFVLLTPILFSIMTGYVIAREYQHNTINNVLTYPYARLTFLIAKIIVVMMTIVATCLLSFGGSVLFGLWVVQEGLTTHDFLISLFSHAIVAALYILLIPLWAFISIVGKSNIPAVIVGLAMIPAPFIIGGSGNFNRVVQFILRAAGMGKPVNIWPSLIILGSLFLIFLLISSLVYTKSDVHSGS
ncbi:MAG TPA: ABC transporter permease [Bacillales bacterium]